MSKPFYEQGRYVGQVTRQHLGESSGGHPQLVLSFTVLGRVNPADPDGELLPVPQQYERTYYRVLTDKTISYALDDMAAVDWQGTSWGQFDEDAPGFVDIRGREIQVSCKHEAHYQTGEPREVWSVAVDSVGPQVKPLEPAAVRKLDALFGKALKERAKKAPAPAAKPAPAVKPISEMANAEIAAEAEDGNDCPF